MLKILVGLQGQKLKWTGFDPENEMFILLFEDGTNFVIGTDNIHFNSDATKTLLQSYGEFAKQVVALDQIVNPPPAPEPKKEELFDVCSACQGMCCGADDAELENKVIIDEIDEVASGIAESVASIPNDLNFDDVMEHFCDSLGAHYNRLGLYVNEDDECCDGVESSCSETLPEAVTEAIIESVKAMEVIGPIAEEVHESTKIQE